MIFAVGEEKKTGIIFLIVFVHEKDKAENIWGRIIFFMEEMKSGEGKVGK